MRESFLHYIWKNQYFDKSNLKTEEGSDLFIFSQGEYNLESGPDFHFARIQIGDEIWVGQVEIHINASEWYAHKHQHDPAYDQVILHVVWNNNRQVFRKDGSRIPVLVIQHRVNMDLNKRSFEFINSLNRQPCESYLNQVKETSIERMIQKAFRIRMKSKYRQIDEVWKQTEYDWNECFYRLFLRSFGFGLNTYAFEKMGKLLSFQILRKVIHNQLQVECLLFGTSGLLSAPKDAYAQKLREEYIFLCHKYSLPHSLELNEWKFSRMRPSNFPALRIAQFAGILFRRPRLLSNIMESDLRGIYDILKAKPSEYWKNHYMFGKASERMVPNLGKDSMNNLIINTIVPWLIFMGEYKSDDSLIKRSYSMIQQLPSERNRIIRLWERNGVISTNAFQSQGLYQLFQSFCKPHNCLHCEIGLSIIGK